jgi:hypothetical protein
VRKLPVEQFEVKLTISENPTWNLLPPAADLDRLTEEGIELLEKLLTPHTMMRNFDESFGLEELFSDSL